MPDFGSFRGFGEKLTQGQTPTQLGKIGSESAFDGDANEFFLRVANAGGTLSNAEKIAVNQLVLDMKSTGIWNSMKAVYPMVGASAAACAQNLKSSSFTGTFSGGWTFASTGTTPNGTTAYFNTNIICQTDLFGKDSSIGYYSRTNNVGLFGDIGNFGSNSNDSISFYTNFNNLFILHYPSESDSTTIANTNSTGFYIGNNSSSVGRTLFRNSTKIINLSFSNVDFPIAANNPRLTISGAYLAAGSPRYSNREIAFAHFATALTDTQSANLYTAVQTFQTSLSRNV